MLHEELGSGGMGTVYAAHDPQLDRRIALKLVHPREGMDGVNDPRARLLLEAQAMARLSHPNVVAVHDVGLYGDGIYMAMELIDGPTLDTWLAEDVDRSWTDVAEVLRAAGEGLAAAHAAGLVHRDFKPQNVMIGRDGRVRVLDFGLVHRVHEVADTFEITADGTGPGAHDSASLVLGAPRTRADSLVGTPAYMAPEQFEAGPVDARTDQFAFCVVTYIALFGKRPYSGDTIPELRWAVRRGRLQSPPQATGVPNRVRRAIERGLSPDPARRFSDMEALLRELRDPRPRWQTWGLAAAGLAAAAGLGFGISAARSPGVAATDPCVASPDALDEVWNDGRRRRIQGRFAQLELRFADVTLAEVERRIDAYASEWLSQHRDACEATHVRREQSPQLLDRRTACLQRRKAALSALVEVLEDADESVGENAIAAAAGLPMLAPCEDLERLLTATDVEEATDPALQHLLARSRAERRASRHERALALAEQAVAQLDRSGSAAERVEAWIELGHAQSALGRRKLARGSFRRAFFAAYGDDLDLLAARAAIGLIELEGVGDREDPAARDWVELAEVSASRAGHSAQLEMELETALAAALGFVGRYDEGLAHAERVVTLAERRHGDDHPETADAYRVLASLQSRVGQHEQATANARRALAVTREAYGAPHPAVVTAERRVGDALLGAGRYQAAQEHFEAAVSLMEQIAGPDHPRWIRLLIELGMVLDERGQHSQARGYFVRALDVAVRVHGERHYLVGDVHNSLCFTDYRLGEYERGRASCERAIDVLSGALGERHPNLAAAHENLALIDRADGKYLDALGHDRAALDIVDRTLGREHPLAGYALLGLGESRLALGEAERALELALAARTNRDDAELEPGLRAEALFLVARARWMARDDAKGRDQARAEGRAARDLVVTAEGDWAGLSRAIDAWLETRG